MNAGWDNSERSKYIDMIKLAYENTKDKKDEITILYELMKKIGERFYFNQLSILKSVSGDERYQVVTSFRVPTIMNLDVNVKFANGFHQFCEEVIAKDEIITTKQLQSYMPNVKSHNSKIAVGLHILKDQQVLLYAEKSDDTEFSDDALYGVLQLKYLIELIYEVKANKEVLNTKTIQVPKRDSITGLLKFDEFVHIANERATDCEEDEYPFIFYADISNFRFFNEQYGFETGDELLCMFVDNFLNVNKYQITGCRVFCDCFIGMTIVKKASIPNLLRTIEAYCNMFTRKVKRLYPDSRVRAAIGVSCIVSRKFNLHQEIDNANMARKLTKKQNKYCILYDTKMEEVKLRKLCIANQADEALLHNEFYVVFQPKVDLRSKEIIGAEALVRWKNKDGHQLYPNEFIPVFEESGFITKLDFYVYMKVFEYIQKRMEQGKKIVPISLNVSRIHLLHNNFADKVMRLIKKYKIPPEYVEFELTESVFLEHSKEAKNEMELLQKQGFLVSMDDFGSGYSSLNLLTTMDFDIIKLDKEFLSSNDLSKRDKVLIYSIIQMAKRMEMKVLCEGVETLEQAKALERMDCDMVQGYYFGRPELIEEFDKRLESVV